MATFVNDTFTGTDGTTLQAHTGEAGATWTAHSSSGGNSLLVSDRVHGNGVTGVYYASGVPTSADYDVSGRMRQITDGGGGVGLCGRMNTSTANYYLLQYQPGTNEWALYKCVAGAFTFFNSYVESLSNGDERDFMLRMRGNQISAYVSGVLRVGPTTDTAHTAAGRAGCRPSDTTATTLGHLASLTATDPTKATGPPRRTVTPRTMPSVGAAYR